MSSARRVGFLILASCMAGGLIAAERAGTVTPSLALKACEIEHPSRLAVISAECGTLSVPENPQNPGGRHIDLYIARVAAINRRKAEDPLFLLAGGPGGSAVDMYANAAPAFDRVHRDRDIVLVDQRGTGRSNALNCELDEDALMSATDEVIAGQTQNCLDTLRKHADVAFYTTSIAVRDLDSVRAALGYRVINLYGASYGTRVAQHYLRRFPERTRSVILDGVVPPQLALGPSLALDAEKALQAVLARCASEVACRERFGDPAESYEKLRGALASKPVAVALADPTTGEPQQIEFSSLHLAMVLRLAIYTSDQAALLPLALDRAVRSADYVPLAGQYLMMSHAFEDMLAFGMHNTVVCAEDVPFFPQAAPEDRAAMERTFLGTTPVDSLRNLCKVWPRGPADADLRTPLETSVPVLLLSGGNDPVTPPAYAEQAKQKMKNSLHLVIAGLGHGQIVAPCIDDVIARFLTSGTTRNLDVSCVRNVRPMPFFTTLAGPQP
jgi:pimeloyl-ACP methyl ester carboxylesterase